MTTPSPYLHEPTAEGEIEFSEDSKDPLVKVVRAVWGMPYSSRHIFAIVARVAEMMAVIVGDWNEFGLAV